MSYSDCQPLLLSTLAQTKSAASLGSRADEEAPAPKDVSKQVVLDDDDALEEDGLDQVALELDDTEPGPLQRLSTVAPAEKAP